MTLAALAQLARLTPPLQRGPGRGLGYWWRRGAASAGGGQGGPGHREFWQRLDEQYLAHELDQMSNPGHHTASNGAQGVKLFDPSVRLRPHRRLASPASAASSSSRGG